MISGFYGRRLLRDELGDGAAVDKLTDYLAATYGDAVRKGTYTLHGDETGFKDCEWQPGLRCDGDRPVLDENAGRRGARAVARSGRARGGRHAQEQHLLIIVPRETPMSLPQLRDVVLRAGAR